MYGYTKEQYNTVKEELDELKQMIRQGEVKRRLTILNLKNIASLFLLIAPSIGMGALALMPLHLTSIFFGFVFGAAIVYGIVLMYDIRAGAVAKVQESTPEINVLDVLNAKPLLSGVV